MSVVLLCRRTAVAAICAVAGTSLVTGSATAGVLVESATSCDSESLRQVFTPWADPASYTPAPDGGFENGAAGWTLGAGAAVSAGNEPWHIRGAGSNALSLAAGSSATSRAMCVGIEHPTIRFFAKRSGVGSLTVEALSETALGGVVASLVAVVTSGSSWAPTAPYAVAANLLPLLPGERTPVAYRFTASNASSWTIDDVEVDPWRGN